MGNELRGLLIRERRQVDRRRVSDPPRPARMPRGERVEHYESVRQRKDGSTIDISLTISPIRDKDGKIVGASKIARDISFRKRAEEQQRLIFREMDHRIKNLFAVAGGVVTMSARSAKTAEELASAVRDRFVSLAKASDLTLKLTAEGTHRTQQSTLLH